MQMLHSSPQHAKKGNKMNLLKITPMNFKCGVQIATPATAHNAHIFAHVIGQDGTDSKCCMLLGCVIKAPEGIKSLLEKSQVILTGESPLTTENLTITQSPELTCSVPNVYVRRTTAKRSN
jgi:hypothetical protein